MSAQRGYFCALVPGEGLDEMRALTRQRCGDRCGSVVGGVTVR